MACVVNSGYRNCVHYIDAVLTQNITTGNLCIITAITQNIQTTKPISIRIEMFHFILLEKQQGKLAGNRERRLHDNALTLPTHTQFISGKKKIALRYSNKNTLRTIDTLYL